MKIISQDLQEQKKAKLPHEIFTLNAVMLHLFLPVALLKFGDPTLTIKLPIFLSTIIIIWTYFRNKKSKKTDSLLVQIHWQLSLNRYKFLIIAYVFYIIINSISLVFFADNPKGMHGTSVIETVFLILGVVPLFIAIFLSVLLGSGSMFNARRGEVPIKLLAKFKKNLQ